MTAATLVAASYPRARDEWLAAHNWDTVTDAWEAIEQRGGHDTLGCARCSIPMSMSQDLADMVDRAVYALAQYPPFTPTRPSRPRRGHRR